MQQNSVRVRIIMSIAGRKVVSTSSIIAFSKRLNLFLRPSASLVRSSVSHRPVFNTFKTFYHSTPTMGIKHDEKKQHFDDIYVEPTPVPYKELILDKLEYISDNFNKDMFDEHILPWAKQQSSSSSLSLQYIDLGACFGNTTMATIYGMTYDEIRENWKDENACQKLQAERRFPCKLVAADISGPAMAYGKQVGMFDEAYTADLNDRSSDAYKQVKQAMATSDIVLSTATLVYLDLETVEDLVGAFCAKKKEGYMLVNFLNPFGAEKANKTKQILLKHCEFVGSRATRHRRMSELEKSNYPGEDWALLELWVLKRRV